MKVPAQSALYQYTLHSTSTLCTVPVHSALYQYTLHWTSTLCTVPEQSALYQYTLYCTSTLFTVPVHSSLYHYPLQYIVDCRPKAGKIFLCLIQLVELEAFYKFKRGQIYIYNGTKNLQFYKFLITKFYILHNCFPYFLHLQWPSISTNLQKINGGFLHSTTFLKAKSTIYI